MTKVKICGITNPEDALLAAKFGADALGFNFYEKSPRFVAPQAAREICAQLPPQILKVGVFVNESPDKILETAALVPLDAVQLHGDETPEFVSRIKEGFSGEVIKALRVLEDLKPEEALRFGADAILLDAYSKSEYGGTGETFNWEIAKNFQEIFPKMYLAGGLSADNIGFAVWSVKPFAVDVCSGVESEKGRKDKVTLINFIAKAKKRLKELSPDNFYDFLSALQQRPAMYFGRKSLTDCQNFLYGFQMGLNLSKAEYDTKHFFSEFNQWATRKLIGKDESAYGWSGVILQECSNDEEKAFDLFFALLEEFKLEKEDLSDE